MKKIILIGILLTIFITACEVEECTSCTQQGYIKRESCPDVQGENISEDIESILVHKIDSGKQPVYLIDDGFFLSIIDCGNNAHGAIVVQAVERILQENSNLRLKDLIITSTEIDYIGGCVEIIQDLPNIRAIYIYGEEKTTAEYKDLIVWSPPSKLTTYRTIEYKRYLNNNEINFSRIEGELVETDGEKYRVLR